MTIDLSTAAHGIRRDHPALPDVRRGPVSYALVPRPQELAVKPVVLVVSYVAGRWAATVDGAPVLAVVALVLVVEGFAYQARYVVNDLLDARLDSEHPASQARGRLPPGPKARRWAAASVAVRLAVAALVTAGLPGRARSVAMLAILSIAAAAIPYEAVRQTLRRSAGPDAIGRVTPAVAVIYLLAGAGFVIRVGAGLAVAGAPVRVIAVSVLFAGPFGVMYTTMAWALQATSFVAPDWSALDHRLARKRHLGPLLGWCAVRPRPGSAPPAQRPVDTRLLARPCAYEAAWTVAASVGAVGAAVLGTTLSNRFGPGAKAWETLLGVVCVVGTLATLRCSQEQGSGLAAARAAVTVGAAVVLVAAGASSLPLLVAIPIGAMLATALVLRTLTYGGVVAFTATLSPPERSRDGPTPPST